MAEYGDMELAEFTRSLSRMNVDDLRAVAAAIDAHSQNAGDEVDAWRATITIDRQLKRCGARRSAAHAAYAATQAVQLAAEHAGIALPDPLVTAVARSAAELARAIVCEAVLEPELRPLVEVWMQYTPLVAA